MLQYANNGTLRECLRNQKIFDSLQWKDKVQMALDITYGAMCLHSENIIHGKLVNKDIVYCYLFVIICYLYIYIYHSIY